MPKDRLGDQRRFHSACAMMLLRSPMTKRDATDKGTTMDTCIDACRSLSVCIQMYRHGHAHTLMYMCVYVYAYICKCVYMYT